MAFATSIGGWQRPALTVGGLGLASGLLSATVGYDLELAWLKPVGTVFIALAFSAAVGIVFGLWPAQKASALQPIEALRYE